MIRANISRYSSRSDFSEYLIAFLAIAITAAICFPLTHVIGIVSIGLILLMSGKE